MVLAWQTDMTRVCTLQVGNETSTSVAESSIRRNDLTGWCVGDADISAAVQTKLGARAVARQCRMRGSAALLTI
jgi:hypothetical protein